MLPRTSVWIAAGMSMLAASVIQAGEATHRQLGAHEHGHGRLSIAIEGTRLDIELEAPGADIVGFENEARSSEEKAVLERARATLGRAEAIFKLPEAAGCRQVAVDVDLAGEHGDAHGGGSDHTGRSDHEGAGHSEAHATYAIECTAPAEVSAIVLDYFAVFPAARALSVEVVTAKGASRFEVGRDKPRIDLTGLM